MYSPLVILHSYSPRAGAGNLARVFIAAQVFGQLDFPPWRHTHTHTHTPTPTPTHTHIHPQTLVLSQSARLWWLVVLCHYSPFPTSCVTQPCNHSMWFFFVTSVLPTRGFTLHQDELTCETGVTRVVKPVFYLFIYLFIYLLASLVVVMDKGKVVLWLKCWTCFFFSYTVRYTAAGRASRLMGWFLH